MVKDDDKAVGRESDKFMLRFPEGMRGRIAELAKTNGRSMNAEIIERLENSMQESEDVREMLAPMQEKLNEIGRILLRQEEERAPEDRRWTSDQMAELKKEIAKPIAPPPPPKEGRKKT